MICVALTSHDLGLGRFPFGLFCIHYLYLVNGRHGKYSYLERVVNLVYNCLCFVIKSVLLTVPPLLCNVFYN